MNDATFRVHEGRSGDPNTVTFESYSTANCYFKHVGFVLRISQYWNETTFNKDIDYFVEPGLADPKGVSFRNKNFPNHYLVFENNVILIKEKYDN